MTSANREEDTILVDTAQYGRGLVFLLGPCDEHHLKEVAQVIYLIDQINIFDYGQQL